MYPYLPYIGADGPTASALPQPPPAPIGPIFAEFSSQLLPDEVSLETFNSEYLQRHSTSAPAILAAAKVQFKLNAPREEVEGTIFTILGDGVRLDVKVSSSFSGFVNRVPDSFLGGSGYR